MSDHSQARRKLFVAKCCAGFSAAVWVAVVFLLIAVHQMKPERAVQSQLDKMVPFFIPVYAGLSIGLLVSLFGLARKKSWAIPLTMTCFALSAFSILLPVSGVGVWALLDRKIKKYFRSFERFSEAKQQILLDAATLDSELGAFDNEP